MRTQRFKEGGNLPTVTQQINLGDRTRPLWLGVSPQHRGGWAAPVVVPGPARGLGRSHDKYRETDSSEDEAHPAALSAARQQCQLFGRVSRGRQDGLMSKDQSCGVR